MQTASTPDERILRLRTLHRAQQIEPLPVDRPVAFVWAELRRALKDTKRKLDENDAWIAATAIVHRLPVVTQDRDYLGIPGLTVIRV